jgi:DNA-binding winged helix-turn-helix (wHTH) protein
VLDFRRQPSAVLERLLYTSVVRFGTYELNLRSRELLKSGVRIKVQHQPLKLLETLLEHRGEVVTREEIRSRIWPNETFGDFDQAVNVAIAKLRGVLGDSADSPRFIETLPRHGYRFIADVSIVDIGSHTKRPAATGGDLPRESSRQQPRGVGSVGKQQIRPTRRVAISLALVLSCTIVTIWLFRSRGGSPPSIRSLAVLPLRTSLAILRRNILPTA